MASDTKVRPCACKAAGRYVGLVKSKTQKKEVTNLKTGKPQTAPVMVHRFECTDKKCGKAVEHVNRYTAGVMWHNRSTGSL